MSLCRLYSSIHLARPGDWRWTPKEGLLVARASGGRSTSRRERSPSSSKPDDDDDGDDDGFPGSSLWDSNVENVRRRNRSRNGEASTAPPDWLTPRKDWTFNSQENTTGEAWWKSPKNEEKYEEEESEEDDDEEDEEDDSDQLFSSLRWGIPVTFVVLPWLLGNPVILLLGLAAVPAVQKAVGPVVSELWEALLRLSGSKRRRKRENFDFNAEEEEEQEEDAYTSWGGQPYRYKRPDKYTAQPLPSSDVDDRVVSREGGNDVSMGGWEDLEDERRRGRMPVRRAKKASKLGWRSSKRKKEKPLLVRLLVALFPFLRNWGGWLSVFLVFSLPW